MGTKKKQTHWKEHQDNGKLSTPSIIYIIPGVLQQWKTSCKRCRGAFRYRDASLFGTFFFFFLTEWTPSPRLNRISFEYRHVHTAVSRYYHEHLRSGIVLRISFSKSVFFLWGIDRHPILSSSESPRSEYLGATLTRQKPFRSTSLD